MSRLLYSKLEGVRRKHRGVAVLSALAAGVMLFVLGLAIGMWVDFHLDLGFVARAVWLGINLAGTGAVLVWWGALPVLFTPDVEQAALWVEREQPDFASRLISAVQFTQPGVALAGMSGAMVRAMVRETETIAAPLDFSGVVKTQRMVRLVTAATVLVVLGCISCVYAGPTGWALLQRALLVPGVAVPRRTHIDCKSGEMTVAQADSITLAAIASGVVPDNGTVQVDFAGGETETFPLDRDGQNAGRFTREIQSVQSSFNYTISLGDNRTEKYSVRTVVRPAVLGVQCTQIYPDYTHFSPENRSPGDLSLLAGSRLAIGIKANKPLKATADVKASHIHFYGSEMDYPLPADINNLSKLAVRDGSEPSVLVPPGTTGFTIELVDEFGLKSKDPVFYRIDLVPDRPPTVRITYPEQKESTVTAIAQPSIGIEASDDFALGKLAIRYRVTKAGQQEAADDVNGLVGNYYEHADFVGRNVTRIDPDLNFEWGVLPPVAGIDHGDFSARWTGSLRPLYTEDYVIRCEFRGGARVWIDGKPLMVRWPHDGDGLESPPLHLEAGRFYSIRVEYDLLDGPARARLSWRSRRQQQEAIPHSALYRAYDPNAGVANANLALWKPVSQSSTMRAATADCAVDGFTDGDGRHGSASQTDNDLHAWWQVDLGAVSPIASIELYNRLDEGRERLNNFYVFVSDTPFEAMEPDAIRLQAGVFQFHQTGAVGEVLRVPVGRTGRYVRVQLAGQNYLQLAEVKVLAPMAEQTAVVKPVGESDGLIGYWTLDDVDEGFVNDAAGQSVGTVFNATRTPGKIGKAIDFTGQDQRVEIPHQRGMSFIASDSFTLSSWINARKLLPGWHGVVTKSRDRAPWYGIWLDPAQRFTSVSPGQNLAGAQATPGWHHVAVVQDGKAKTRTIFVDGVAGQSGQASDGTGEGDLVFGAAKGANEPFDGQLDDVRLYARALSRDEIANLFRTPAALKTTGVAAGPAGSDSINAQTIDLDLGGQTPKSLKRRFVWDLSKLASPITIGDAIEFWAEAKDTNDVTGPGIASSEHLQFHLVSEADKRAELMNRLGDYLGQINDVSETQRDLNAKLGQLITGRKE